MSSQGVPKDSPSSLKTEDEYHVETLPNGDIDEDSVEDVAIPQQDFDNLNDVDEDSGDDGESTASTAGSLVPPDPGDLVDLTNENVCRVKYRRRVDGKDVEVACGTPIEECVRKKHNLWRLNPATRCGPGYYYPVIKNNGEVLPDGKLSERWFTPEEMCTIVRSREDEKAFVSTVLESNSPTAAGSRFHSKVPGTSSSSNEPSERTERVGFI